MSKNNSFSVTTAGRYSLALYELAKENNSVDEVEEQSVSLLKLIDDSKDFSLLIALTQCFNWLTEIDFLIIDCYRLVDPNDYTRVYNDHFLKKYATALLKRQWGQNLMKFQGVKLPGGIELNGRQIYDDAINDLTVIREQMSNTYEIPPLDLIG